MNQLTISIQNLYLKIPIIDSNLKRFFSVELFHPLIGGDIKINEKFTYINAIDNISLNIFKGERVALIGQNGSGKTTLLKTISNIYRNYEGYVEVNGKINCIFDLSLALNGDLTGIEYIKYWCLLKNIPKENIPSVIVDCSNFSELGNFLFLPTRTYSDGMRSRLQVSLATLLDTDILLIDEGIGAGDAKFQEKFKLRLDNFVSRASTLILASHNVSLLKQFCSRGVVLSKGKIIFDGNLDLALDFYNKL
jgi:ABC-type polysaccharide/polyol phosphate transport system ATPase subunit